MIRIGVVRLCLEGFAARETRAAGLAEVKNVDEQAAGFGHLRGSDCNGG